MKELECFRKVKDVSIAFSVFCENYMRYKTKGKLTRWEGSQNKSYTTEELFNIFLNWNEKVD